MLSPPLLGQHYYSLQCRLWTQTPGHHNDLPCGPQQWETREGESTLFVKNGGPQNII